MKMARFRHGGAEHTGRIDGTHVVPLSATSPLEALLGDAEDIGAPLSLDSVQLLAPVTPVRNVLCVGWNYLPHFEEGTVVHGERPLPDRPTFFTKSTESVIGPFDAMPSHRKLTEKLDWEVELAAIIGERAVDVPEDRALSIVAGYSVALDVSARDLQHAHGKQWFKGKSLDGTCPIGPWLVSADKVGDPQNLDIELSIDGEMKQSSNTSTMIFSIARIIAELSEGMTLVPGDIILTGTPEGVGQSRTPPEFMTAGMRFEATVEKVGTIRPTVRD
jgi:2-keto-4-pentenoate hydratase/2-oxohepta-3-ene-1,7-dioic acid hydratase in catechol pathway